MIHRKLIKTAVPFFAGAFLIGNGSSAPLDMTIKGKARDRIEIERVAPNPDVPMKDVIPFSRLGQTDWILSEELGYLDEEKQISMMDVNSPKVLKPSMIEFPKPPYFVQAYPPPPEPIIVDRRPDAPPLPGEREHWTFIVFDQNNRLLKKMQGNTPPVEAIKWDGMSRGKFMLRTDEIYSSVLFIQESPEVSRTIIGDPIWMPALRYLKGNKIVYEFSNKSVYADQQTGFSPALKVLVDQLMNSLRKHEGAPFDVVIYAKDLELGQRRSAMWKEELEKNLLKNRDNFQIRVSLPSDRGEVTQVSLAVTK